MKNNIVLLWVKKNNDIVRKRQEDIDAKENNEIKETLNTVSYKDVKESKKRLKIIELVLPYLDCIVVVYFCK